MHLPKFLHFFLRTIFAAALFTIFVGIPATGYWLSTFGFPASVVREVERAIGGGRIDLKIGRITFSPFSGITAREVVVIAPDGTHLASTDRVTISVNLSALVKKKFQIDGFELVDTTLRLPDSLVGTPLFFEGVDAKIVVVPGIARLSRCHFSFEGMEFFLSGDFLHPEFFHPSRDTPQAIGEAGKAPSEQSNVNEILKRVLAEIREMRFERPPTIRAILQGDFSKSVTPDVLEFSIDLGGVEWRGASLESLRVRGTFISGEFRLDSLEARDANGSLLASGFYSLQTHALRMQGVCSLDPLPWLRALGKGDAIREMSLAEAAEIEVRIDADLATSPMQIRVEGEAIAHSLIIRGVQIDEIRAPFAWRPGLFLTRGASVSAPALKATIDAMLEDDRVKLRARGTVNLTLCLPLLEKGMQNVFRFMKMEEPAAGEIELEWPVADFSKLYGTGKIVLGRSSMRGAWIDSASADIQISNRAVTYSNLDVRVGTGKGTGTFVYDFGNKRVLLRDIRSTLDPVTILLWIDEGIAENVRPYRFNLPPTVRGQGIVDMASPEKNQLEFQITAPSGMKYELLSKILPFDRVQGRLAIRGQQLIANVEHSEIFGGTVKLRADVSLAPENKTYTLNFQADDVDFASMTRLYFGYEGSTGKMDMHFAYRANMEDQTTLEGQGSLRVEHGDVFAIPIFGPLSGILNSILPGTGYETARLATADFVVRDRKISTKNLEIIGQGFSLYGAGDIFFTEDRMNMAVRINARGAPGFVLMPFSKLFEYVSTDSFSNPIWRPKNVPREIYELFPGTTASRKENASAKKADANPLPSPSSRRSFE
jgi:hypothetical protein